MRIVFWYWPSPRRLPALADEGMWTFDNFPRERRKADLWRGRDTGVAGSRAAFDHSAHELHGLIRLARRPDSDQSPLRRIVSRGTLFQGQQPARTRLCGRRPRAERRCATQLADVLVGMENVTAAVRKASAGLERQGGQRCTQESTDRSRTGLRAGERQGQVRASSNARPSPSTKAANTFSTSTSATTMCGWYSHPESDIAAFGGDPDNFQFPRWSLDFSVLRAYEHGKPAKTPNYLQDRFRGAARRRTGVRLGASRLDFAPGDSGATRVRARYALPTTLLRSSELRGGYIQFGRGNQADEQLIEAPLNSLENGIKVRRKLLDALHDDALMARKKDEESALRVAAQASPAPIRGNKSNRRPPASGRSICPTPSSRAPPDSTASCSATRACWCAAPTSGRSPTPSGCANSPRPRCRASSSSSTRGADLCRGRGDDAVLLAAAHARVAGAGLSAGAQLARQGIARCACDAARGGNQARRCRRAQAAVGGRQEPRWMRRAIR